MASDRHAPVRAALIGFGNIGHEITRQAAAMPSEISICGLFDVRNVAGDIPSSIPVVASLPDLLATEPDIIVEPVS